MVEKRHVGAETPGKLAETDSLSESAYETLKGQILTKRLRPGEALVEAKLAKELGMSRTPIRDALTRLRHEGLVKSFPNRGSFVESLSPMDVAEIYDMREVVEGLAARLLARRITQEQAEALEELAVEADNPAARVEDDIAFHSGIIGMCGSRRVAEAVQLLSLSVLAYDESAGRLTSDSGAPTLGRGRVPKAHHFLAREIVSGNGAKAEEKAREHVRLGKRTAGQFLLGIEDAE